MKITRYLGRVLLLALSLAGPVWAQRAVTVVVPGNLIAGAGTAAIVLASQGDENAIGFSVTFDPAVLRYDGFTAGADAGGATINPNDSQKATGKVGFALAVPTGARFGAGLRELVVLKLTALAAANEAINFASSPILREISNATAGELPATYRGLAIATRP